MGVRFTGSFKPYIDDQEYEEVTVEIHDIQGGGNLPIRVESLYVYGEAEAREPISTIVGARAEVSFLIEDDTYIQFIEDLATQVTDRFYVVLTNRSYQFFVGVITHDFVEYDDYPFPFPFTVNAVDGLSRMKDIDYLDEDGEIYEGSAEDGLYIPAMDHIFNCFSKLNLQNIYDTSYDIKRIWVQDRWYATNMGDHGSNPLEQWYIHPEVFFDRDNDGKIQAKSCYDVLEAILQPRGLSVKYGRGIYRIDQWSSRHPTTDQYWCYNFDGTPAGERNQTWRRYADERQLVMPKAIGKFGFLTPLRQVKVRYEYNLAAVAPEPDLIFGFGSALSPGTYTDKQCLRVPNYSNTNFGTKLAAIGSYTIAEDLNPLVFRCTFQLMIKTTFNKGPLFAEDSVPHRIKVRVWLGIKPQGFGTPSHTWSARIDSSLFDVPVAEEKKWESNTSEDDLTLGGWDFLTEPLLSINEFPVIKYYDIGFETDEYPESDPKSIKPFVCAGIVAVETPNGDPLGTDYSIEYAISNFNVIYAEKNFKSKPTIEVVEAKSSINEGGKGDKEITVLVGDRGSTSKVWDGSQLVAPGGWGVNGGGDKELAQLLADEYHKLRGKPIRTMSRTFIGRENLMIDMMNCIDYCDQFWVPMQSSHDYYTQEITATYWAAKETYSTPEGSATDFRRVYKEYNVIDTRNEVPAIGPGRREAIGVDGDGFTANATKFIFTDGTLPNTSIYTAEQIRKMVDVYINGDKLWYVEGSPVGPTYHGIDNTDNSITLDPNFPLSARHKIQVFLRAL